LHIKLIFNLVISLVYWKQYKFKVYKIQFNVNSAHSYHEIKYLLNITFQIKFHEIGIMHVIQHIQEKIRIKFGNGLTFKTFICESILCIMVIMVLFAMIKCRKQLYSMKVLPYSIAIE
jgi:hypothetical protein